MLYAVTSICFVIIPSSTLDNSIKLSISWVPVVAFLTSVNAIFNLLAPGAFSFVVPEALSSKELSSVELIKLSAICKPILSVGVFEYLSNKIVCSSHLTKKPLV